MSRIINSITTPDLYINNSNPSENINLTNVNGDLIVNASNGSFILNAPGPQGPTGPRENYTNLSSLGTRTNGTGPGYIVTSQSAIVNIQGIGINLGVDSNLYVPSILYWTSNTGCFFYRMS